MMPIAPATPSLRGVSIVKTYGDGAKRLAALKDVSMDLFPGQLALLMGPSGSGKSTLLAILSGLLEPDSGQVLAEDEGEVRDVWAMSAKQREDFRLGACRVHIPGVQFVPGPDGAAAAGDRVKVGRRPAAGRPAGGPTRCSTARAGEPAQEAGAVVGRREAAGGDRPGAGQEPDFVFADEPTSALDWENGQKVIELLRDAAHERGASILVVSHDHRMVPYVDVSYHLEDGHLEERRIAELVGSGCARHCLVSSGAQEESGTARLREAQRRLPMTLDSDEHAQHCSWSAWRWSIGSLLGGARA